MVQALTGYEIAICKGLDNLVEAVSVSDRQYKSLADTRRDME
jgi:hypothetical protein